MLPAYALVQYFNSRAQFKCENCVQSMENLDYDAQLAWVTALTEKENEEANKQPSEPSNQSPNQNEKEEKREENEEEKAEEGDEEEEKQEEDDEKLKKKDGRAEAKDELKNNKICKFYQRNIHMGCRAGRSGKDCNYQHPEVCWRYLNHGAAGTKGCKLDKQCRLFHPTVCRNSIGSGKCLTKECRFTHLKGTKRVASKPNVQYKDAVGGKKEAEGRKNVTPPKPEPAKAKIPEKTAFIPTEEANHQTTNDSNNFLCMQRELQHLQTQMHQVMKMMQMQINWSAPGRPLLPAWDPNINLIPHPAQTYAARLGAQLC
jgi:hypothetical protein